MFPPKILKQKEHWLSIQKGVTPTEIFLNVEWMMRLGGRVKKKNSSQVRKTSAYSPLLATFAHSLHSIPETCYLTSDKQLTHLFFRGGNGPPLHTAQESKSERAREGGSRNGESERASERGREEDPAHSV